MPVTLRKHEYHALHHPQGLLQVVDEESWPVAKVHVGAAVDGPADDLPVQVGALVRRPAASLATGLIGIDLIRGGLDQGFGDAKKRRMCK